MKKNIVIVVLSILVITFFLFSYIKASEATKQHALAEVAAKEAMLNAEEAQKQSELAVEAAAEARKAQANAAQMAEELRICQSR